MSYAAKTLLAFGIYLLGLGSGLVFVPNLMLGIFRISSTSEVWIRVVGMLLLILASYDILAARAEFRPFFVWSVPLRLSVMAFFLAYVLLGFAPPILLLFAIIDVAFATWTWTALRGEDSKRLERTA
jgi:hypothetical protein